MSIVQIIQLTVEGCANTAEETLQRELAGNFVLVLHIMTMITMIVHWTDYNNNEKLKGNIDNKSGIILDECNLLYV